jgi:hypothetical protein
MRSRHTLRLASARHPSNEVVELIRETLVRLTWKGDRICAMLGIDFQEDRAGFGFTVPEALRELAAQIDRRDITVWVQRPARPYREGEAVKVACPECGHITEFSDFDSLDGFVCAWCLSSVDIQDETP